MYIQEGEMKIPQAEVYILGAWHPMYRDLLELPGKVGVLWTSSPGEMDFEPVEREYLDFLRNSPQVKFIWFGDVSLARCYPEKSFWAPYPLEVEGELEPYLKVIKKKDIATLLCPSGPKKNIYNQLLAMKLVQREKDVKLTLYTNVTGYDDILSEIDHVKVGWLGEFDYRTLVASAKVNLACSWAETFNYNVAEAIILGTQSVISKTIPHDGSVVENPNDPEEIARNIRLVAKLTVEAYPKGYPEYQRHNMECKETLTSQLASLK